MAVILKGTAFWYVMPCTLVDVCHCFKDTCYQHCNTGESTLMMRAPDSSEILCI
jgi:hypothetical protein